MRNDSDIGAWFAALLFAGAFFAWLTHIVVCLSQGEWGFLIAGALFFPVAVVHGVGVWFEVWG